METAAQMYQRASDARIGQASFNLGYMHEHGIGVEKDLFLAKRYYDFAKDHDIDGRVPAWLALVKWWVHYKADEYLGQEGVRELAAVWESILASLLIAVLIGVILLTHFHR